MPFVLIVAGVVLIAVAVRGTHQQFYQLVKGDFIGPNNFIYWVLAIAVVGAIGYVPKLKPISDGFLVLIILVLFLHDKGGFFTKFNEQIALTGKGSAGGSLPSVGGSRGGIVIQPGSGGGVSIGGGGAPVVISL